ncbi:MAG: DUF1573 domain-containing protein [Bacteroidales bacterium]|jgi:hypothetical protein|nr:DUF1573 domain-containing protein [Bacteroidales bacterium]
MKKHIAIWAFICFLIGVANAQTSSEQTQKPVNGPEIQFEKLYFDFGELKIGDVKEVSLSFKNIGNRPLILDDAISSCDCTTVTWPKEPVMPGKTGTIKARYEAKYSGLISKRITVLSNAESDRVILQLKGNVL